MIKPSRNRQERRTLSPVQIFTSHVNIARQMQPQSSAREFSGTIEEVLETAQSVGCSGVVPSQWRSTKENTSIKDRLTTKKTPHCSTERFLITLERGCSKRFLQPWTAVGGRLPHLLQQLSFLSREAAEASSRCTSCRLYFAYAGLPLGISSRPLPPSGWQVQKASSPCVFGCSLLLLTLLAPFLRPQTDFSLEGLLFLPGASSEHQASLLNQSRPPSAGGGTLQSHI